MYQGKHVKCRAVRRRKWNRSFVLLVSILVLLIGIVGGSLAFLVDDADPVVNIFTPGKVSCSINEPGWVDRNSTVKSDVTVTNTGNTDAYIRAAIVVTWVDSAGNIAPEVPVLNQDYTLVTGSDWNLDGGYYYYSTSVAPQSGTTNLVETCQPLVVKDGYTLCVDIIADAVQSNGVASNGKKAVVEAWGVDPEPTTEPVTSE